MVQSVSFLLQLNPSNPPCRQIIYSNNTRRNACGIAVCILRMAEKEALANYSKRKQVRQPPAVPFLWEVKPGMPKKDWKLGFSSVSPTVTSPIKLITSLPFDWEEKPATPLPCFSEPAVLPSQPQKLLCLPSPPMFSQGFGGVNYGTNEYSDDGHDERNGSSELDFEAFDFDSDDSFRSAASLLANCLVPSVAISSAIPVEKSSLIDNVGDNLEISSTPASEIDSSTSSYTTGTSSPVGASFLECLFPLLPPKSGFLKKAGHTESSSLTTADVKCKDFDSESNCSVAIRRTTTLEELIMMSRRRSYQRKAVQMRKQNLSMEYEKRASGCCIFGTNIKRIEGLQRKKHKLILKLLF